MYFILFPLFYLFYFFWFILFVLFVKINFICFIFLLFLRIDPFGSPVVDLIPIVLFADLFKDFVQLDFAFV
jgi:hypothetical protein